VWDNCCRPLLHIKLTDGTLNDYLKLQRQCAYANGIFIVVEGPDFFKLGAVTTIGRLYQAPCPLWREFWLEGYLEVETRSVGFALAIGLCDLGDAITSAEGLHDRGRWAVPLWIIMWNMLYNWWRARKTSIELAGKLDYTLHRLGCVLRDCLGLPAENQFTSVIRGGLQPAHVRHECLPSCLNKGFLVSANFESKLSVSVLMWSAKNGIHKSSWICLFPTYQGALVAMRRHLDCKSCRFRTWLRAADLPIGHA
jgi:hypothetical protein